MPCSPRFRAPLHEASDRDRVTSHRRDVSVQQEMKHATKQPHHDPHVLTHPPAVVTH